MNGHPVSLQNRTHTAVAAYLLLIKKNEICLLLRKNTGYCDGMYSLIAGHVEENEFASAAMLREAKEEAGLDLALSQLQVAHVLHRKSNRMNIEVFFLCTEWEGSVQNLEPHKCEHLQFFPIHDLPSNTIEYIVRVIQAVERGEFYSEIA
jgi:8-oxo-dGTP diphosphatase